MGNDCSICKNLLCFPAPAQTTSSSAPKGKKAKAANLHQIVASAYCGHLYHKVCITEWLKKDATTKVCPRCPSPIAAQHMFPIPSKLIHAALKEKEKYLTCLNERTKSQLAALNTTKEQSGQITNLKLTNEKITEALNQLSAEKDALSNKTKSLELELQKYQDQLNDKEFMFQKPGNEVLLLDKIKNLEWKILKDEALFAKTQADLLNKIAKAEAEAKRHLDKVEGLQDLFPKLRQSFDNELKHGLELNQMLKSSQESINKLQLQKLEVDDELAAAKSQVKSLSGKITQLETQIIEMSSILIDFKTRAEKGEKKWISEANRATGLEERCKVLDNKVWGLEAEIKENQKLLNEIQANNYRVDALLKERHCMGSSNRNEYTVGRTDGMDTSVPRADNKRCRTGRDEEHGKKRSRCD